MQYVHSISQIHKVSRKDSWNVHGKNPGAMKKEKSLNSIHVFIPHITDVTGITGLRKVLSDLTSATDPFCVRLIKCTTKII